MITIYPEFYAQFHCKADKCQHSCCVGWEIDIDSDAANTYLNMSGDIGDKLRRNIRSSGNNQEFFFSMTKDNICPFLQKDGLCELILKKGESILCEICAAHPRFFTYLDDIEFAGVGLCCEYSVELLLKSDEPNRFYIHYHSGEEKAKNIERVNYAGLIPVDFQEMIDHLGIYIPPQDIYFYLPKNFNINEYVRWTLEVMEETEPIDKAWIKLVKKLKTFQYTEDLEKLFPQKDIQYDKLYQYILYRQFENLCEYTDDVVVEFSRMNVIFIWLAAKLTGDLREAIRQWSAQIEYDFDNVFFIYGKIIGVDYFD